VRVVRYQGNLNGTQTQPQTQIEQPDSDEIISSSLDDVEKGIYDHELELENMNIGLVSVGEIKLNSLKPLIEAAGITVQTRIVTGGVVLVCADQVIIRKKKDSNDFIIEGPPIPAFYEARKALYKQYVFV